MYDARVNVLISSLYFSFDDFGPMPYDHRERFYDEPYYDDPFYRRRPPRPPPADPFYPVPRHFDDYGPFDE